MNLLEVKQVSKHFGSKAVLKDLTFSIPKGSIFGFVGKNGAGKTTTMKLILGLDEIDQGEIYLKGQKVVFGETPTNQLTGYLPDVPEFYDYMTAREYLLFCSEVTYIPKKNRKKRVEEMLMLVGLAQEKKQIKGFSRGMKQRMGIAQALLNEPEFLICDEPTSALDPNGRNEFLSLLASLKGKVTILFSTHILSDVERICDYVGILDQGTLQITGELETLKERFAQPQIAITFEQEEEAEKLISLLSGQAVQSEGNQVLWSYQGTYSNAFKQVLELLLNADLTAKSLRHIAPSLEQIYLEVTK